MKRVFIPIIQLFEPKLDRPMDSSIYLIYLLFEIENLLQ